MLYSVRGEYSWYVAVQLIELRSVVSALCSLTSASIDPIKYLN
jgi:hypothetical protein